MCEPISGTAMALGAAQAGVGALGAVNSYNSQRQQTRTANNAQRDQYLQAENARGLRYRNQLSVYNRRLTEYDLGEDRAGEALARGYAQNQARLNEVYDAAAFSTQAGAIGELQARGRALASGRSGQSVDMVMQDSMAAYGRNQAILAANLLGAEERFNYDVDSLRRQYITNREQAFSNVATPPQPGLETPKPRFTQGPSALGLVADLGQAAVSGFSTYQDLKAPDIFKNKSNGTLSLDQALGKLGEVPFIAAGENMANGLAGRLPGDVSPVVPNNNPVPLQVIPYQP